MCEDGGAPVVITLELPRALGVTLDSGTAMSVESRPATVRDAFAELGRKSPAALDRLVNERGELRQHVNVFIDAENVRYMQGLDSPIPDGSTVYVLAAISGG
jgi:molybdopterin synthase sulfur carrier subunit